MSTHETFPEPVPAASQLAIMPFVAAIAGFLGPVPRLRITMHRAMSREGRGFLQQACGYMPLSDSRWRSKVGRIFRVTDGIMGAAYKDGRIWRTPSFASVEQLRAALADSMSRTGDTRSVDDVGSSWLAVPFKGPDDEVVLILFAECARLNFFACDATIRQIVDMCNGFCRLFDWLQDDPFSNLRNFPLDPGAPVVADPTVYPMQEAVEIDPPKFQAINSFNYEASVA